MKLPFSSTCSGCNGAITAHISNPAMYCSGKVPMGLLVMRFCMIEPKVMLASASSAKSIPIRETPPRLIP
ncbi:hypothetical protein D3C75_1086500 [compost metagenome]